MKIRSGVLTAALTAVLACATHFDIFQLSHLTPLINRLDIVRR